MPFPGHTRPRGSVGLSPGRAAAPGRTPHLDRIARSPRRRREHDWRGPGLRRAQAAGRDEHRRRQRASGHSRGSAPSGGSVRRDPDGQSRRQHAQRCLRGGRGVVLPPGRRPSTDAPMAPARATAPGRPPRGTDRSRRSWKRDPHSRGVRLAVSRTATLRGSCRCRPKACSGSSGSW
jgi:hypothetical protein